MKRVKLTFMVAVFAAFALMTSCNNNDDYDNEVHYFDLATVVPITDGYSLRLDDGTTLLPNMQDLHNIKSSRAFVDYVIVGDSTQGYTHSVSVRYLNYVLTKGVIDLTAANADSIGNDKAKKLDMWVGDDYLNIQFAYDAGGYAMHLINLVNNTLATPPVDGKTHLEFRHNAKNDTGFLADGIVCFDLRPYRVVNQDSVNLVIKFTEPGGDVEYPIVYKYGGPTANHSVKNMDNPAKIE